MELNDFLNQGRRVSFQQVRPLCKILLIRQANDGVTRAYVGTVKQVRKPNAYVIDMFCDSFFENSVHSTRFKAKDISFRNDSKVTVFLLEDVSFDAKKRLAEERKAYAQARKALQQARAEDVTHFSLLGLTPDSSMDDLKKARKRIMIKWHPDREAASGLGHDSFMIESKKFTDALAYVENYIKVKQSRIS